MSHGGLEHLARAGSRLYRMPRAGAAIRVDRIAVIGAGVMGSGIAAALVPFVRVTLIDPDSQALGAGVRRVQRHLHALLKSGVISATGCREASARLITSAAWPAESQTDVVIEAVPEDLKLKQRLLHEIQPSLRADAVWATTSSALPLYELSRGAAQPENVVGMHFFHPAETTRLVELVAAHGARQEALATVRVLAVLLGKAALDTRDSPGFFTTRVLSAYLGEALQLFAAGVPAPTIDRAAERFGFACGPLLLLDRIGLDVAAAVAAYLGSRQVSAPPATGPLATMVGAGFLGVKSGAGFYVHRRGETRRPNPELRSLLGLPAPVRTAPGAIADRLVTRFVAEAERAVGKRLVPSAAVADVACVLALGFPAATGGPLYWARRQELAQ